MKFLGEQQLLQSSEWERVQSICGKKVFRVYGNLFIIYQLPFVGDYAYCPRGPKEELRHVKDSSNENVQKAFQEMAQEIQKRTCGWMRFEPETHEALSFFQHLANQHSLSLVPAPHDVQPREILVMNISESSETLLSQMKSKTRYNIRLSEKKGVQIILSKEKKYRDQFYDLVQITARRAGIRTHSKEHYESIFTSFGEGCQLFNALYQGKIIASSMVLVCGKNAFYLHGASSNEYRNVMAPFLLQWKVILYAKENGCIWYDIGGVAIKDEKNIQKTAMTHQMKWQGITTFKQGFCPQTKAVRFPGTYDLVISPWRYRAYSVLHRIRKSI